MKNSREPLRGQRLYGLRPFFAPESVSHPPLRASAITTQPYRMTVLRTKRGHHHRLTLALRSRRELRRVPKNGMSEKGTTP